MALPLHEFHHQLNARFDRLNGAEVVTDYGDWASEYTALTTAAGILDLSFRSRLCLTGNDRARFLHGQVTNDVKRLQNGQGCYAALVTAKGKMQSDLNIYALKDELLLDFEPGLVTAVTERLEKFLVADDVEIVDVGPLYGLLSVQGPKATDVVRALEVFPMIPAAPFQFESASDSTFGEIYLMSRARLASVGFDLFVPTASLGAVADRLIAAARQLGGHATGWQALEAARIAAGVPRFGVDMDETHIALECGIETAAVSYIKGCYIGQEVINRIHSIGHVNRELRRLDLGSNPEPVPQKGTMFTAAGKEAGYLTSAVAVPGGAVRGLGYVRREFNQPGTELLLRQNETAVPVRVLGAPVV